MPNKSSQDEALSKMDRSQLIEVIYALQRIEKRLIREREDLKKRLQETLAKEGASAEAFDAADASASQIIEQAKATAGKYLESVRDMTEKAKIANTNVVEAAEKQAAAILRDAEIRARQIIDEANIVAGNPEVFGQDPDGADPYDDDWEYDSSREDLSPQSIYMSTLPPDELRALYPDLNIDDEAEEDEAVYDHESAYGAIDEDEDAGDEFEDDNRIRPEDIMAPTVKITLGEEDLWEEEPAEEPVPDMDGFVSDFDPMELYPDEFEEQIREFEQNLDEEADAFAADLEDELADEREFLEDDITSSAQESEFLGEIDSQTQIDAAADALVADQGETPKDADGNAFASAGASVPPKTDVPTSANNAGETTSMDDAQASTAEDASNADDTRPFEPLDPSISGILSMSKAERKAAKKAAKKARRAAKRSGNPRLEKMKSEAGESLSEDAKPPAANAPGFQSEPDEQSKVAQLGDAKERLKSMSVPEIMQTSYESFTKANLVHESVLPDFEYEDYLDEAETAISSKESGA